MLMSNTANVKPAFDSPFQSSYILTLCLYQSKFGKKSHASILAFADFPFFAAWLPSQVISCHRVNLTAMLSPSNNKHLEPDVSATVRLEENGPTRSFSTPVKLLESELPKS